MRLVRFTLLSALLIGILALALPAGAGGSWHFYAFNNTTKELVRVYGDGTSESFILPLDLSIFVSGFGMAVSPVESKLAFCAGSPAADPNSPANYAVYLYDVGSPQITLTAPMGTPMACTAARFNELGDLLAISLVNYFPGDPIAAESGLPAWQLLLMEVATGQIVGEINAANPTWADYPDMAQFPSLLPMIPYFEGANVVLQAMPFGIGGAITTVPAYTWDYTQNSVTPAPAWGNMFQASLGPELVYAVQDPNLPGMEQFDMTPPHNAVYSAEKDGSQRLLYTDSDEFILDIRYINDGQALALQLVPGTPSSDGVFPSSRWIALDRTGAVTDLNVPSESGYPLLRNAPGGYLVFDIFSGADGSSSYSASLITTAGATPLWNASSPTFEAGYWELVWAVPAIYPDEATPFPSVQ